jgi:hypothetical protein
MVLPPLFALLGPLSDPDFDIVEDYAPTLDILEVPTGPKYIVICSASQNAVQNTVQNLEFLEEPIGELKVAKKLLNYESLPTKIKFKHSPTIYSVQIKKTNLFLSRQTMGRGYTMVPIYKIIAPRSIWYFPIEKQYKRILLEDERDSIVASGLNHALPKTF